MYDENNGQDINNNLNPDENRREENIPNFIMQDSTVEQGRTIPQNACEPDNFRQQNDFQQLSSSGQPSGSGQQGSSGQPSGSGQPGSSGQPSSSGQPNSSGQPGNPYQQNNPYQSASYEPRYNSSYIPPEPPKKKARKKHPIAGKAAAITAAALLFGMVAGGTIVGVNTLADSFKKHVYPQVSQAETQEETTVGNGTTTITGADIPASTTALTDVSGIVEKAMPSVVAINNTMLYQSNNFFGQTQTYEVPGSGSGIIVGQNDDELLIVTNNHVVADSNTLSVVFIDETAVSAAIKGTDPQSDLAVVAVPLKDIPADTLSKISVATLG
ncbi:MAG: trypsin-like peptidase domain-containing protein, partial [Hungatella sp.]